MKRISKKQVIVLIIFLLSLCLISICALISTNPSWAESWTRSVSRFYVTIVGSFTNLISLSLTEIFFIFGTILLITLLVKSINRFRHKNHAKGIYYLTLIITLISVTISGYSLACGPAYNREELPIELYEEKVENQKFEAVFAYFLEDYNRNSKQINYYENGSVKLPYSIDELSYLIVKEYAKIDDDYFHLYSSRNKIMMTSPLYLEFHITGLTFNLLGEANVNGMINESDLPFTIAHEMAHSKGVMREDDANLMAAYVLLNSDNPYFKFSAYRRTYFNLLDLAQFLKDGDEIRNYYIDNLTDEIKRDMNYTYNLYKEHDLLNDLATWFNNLYLKIFGQDGVSSYDDNMEKEDSGEKDEEGEIIYNPIFSRTQKLFFQIYFEEE